MRAAHIVNGVVINIVMIDSLISGYVTTDTANIGDSYNGSTFSSPVITPIVSTTPNGDGFLQAMKVGLGGIVAVASLPNSWALDAAIRSQQWGDVQALLINAKATSVLTQIQYDSVKTAAEAFNIPVTL